MYFSAKSLPRHASWVFNLSDDEFISSGAELRESSGAALRSGPLERSGACRARPVEWEGAGDTMSSGLRSVSISPSLGSRT